MFRRLTLLALPALAIVACDVADAGPTRTRESAFSYSSQLAPGATVHVRTARGDIQVEPASDDSLRVVGDLEWRGLADPTNGLAFVGSAVSDGVLICANWSGSVCTADAYNVKLGRDARRTRVNFRIQVPTGVKLELVGLDGEITTASTGSVMARGVNGDIMIVTARGPVQAETLNGDVDVRMGSLSGTDSVSVKTLNGEAWVFLPESADATVDLAISNGDLVTDFPTLLQAATRKKTLQGVLGAGTTPVRIRSMNGTVGLRRLDALGRAFELGTP